MKEIHPKKVGEQRKKTVEQDVPSEIPRPESNYESRRVEVPIHVV